MTTDAPAPPAPLAALTPPRAAVHPAPEPVAGRGRRVRIVDFAPAAAFGGCIAVAITLAAAGAGPTLGLVGYAALVATVAGLFGLTGAVASVPLAWLFLDGFLVHRQGELGWDGGADPYRLALLTATAVAALGARAVLVRHAGPAQTLRNEES